MAQNNGKINDCTHAILSRFAAEKKKTVIAVCLISLMAFMWIKVFMGKGPKSAEAALVKENAYLTTDMVSEFKVSFIELPKIEGRNDVLNRDFFSADGWQGFPANKKVETGAGQVNVISEEGREDMVRRVANKLRLEAIELGTKPRVFINDKLLSMGDRLYVKDGNRTYECEVIRIMRNMVILRCEKSQIKLELLETTEVVD